MFAHDRDLLAIDPTLFTTVAFSAQALIRGSCTLKNTTLKLIEQPLTFDAANITDGHVITVDTLPLEVLSRIDKFTLQVSLLRGLPSDPPQPLADRDATPCSVFTFAPQLQLAHAELQNQLGLRPGESLINWRDFITLEALGALRHILASAGLFATTVPNADALRQSLASRISLARQGLVALIDTDNDGIANTTRFLNTLTPRRS